MRLNLENRKPSRNQLYDTLVANVKYQSIEDRLARLRKNSSMGNLQKQSNLIDRKTRVDTQPAVLNKQIRPNRYHMRQNSEIDFEKYMKQSDPNRYQKYEKSDIKPVIEPLRKKKYEYTKSNDIIITPERTPCNSTPKQQTNRTNQNLNQRNFLRKKKQ